jgi:hypothetical protein
MHAKRTIDKAWEWHFERVWHMRDLLLGIAPVLPPRPGTFLGLLMINVKRLVFVIGGDWSGSSSADHRRFTSANSSHPRPSRGALSAPRLVESIDKHGHSGNGMVVLYHATAWVASAKTRLVLHEKQLDWQSHVLDLQRGDQHRPAYRTINRNALVPALVHDGRAVPESTVIMEYIEETFRLPSLMPSEPYRRAMARLRMRMVDEFLHGACATLTVQSWVC